MEHSTGGPKSAPKLSAGARMRGAVTTQHFSIDILRGNINQYKKLNKKLHGIIVIAIYSEHKNY